MSNIWLSQFNWIEANSATLTADVEAGELVVDNLRKSQAYKMWRTDGLSPGSTDAGFSVDFGKVREVECVALYFPRVNDPTAFDEPEAFAADDTVRHRLSAVSAGAGELYDSGVIASGVLPGYGYHVLRLPEAVSARYWRVDLDAISRGDLGYVDVSNAWAGPVLAPAIGFSFGDNYGWVSDSSVSSASRGIAEFVDNIESRRQWAMQLDGVSDTERELFIDLERRITTGARFLVARSDISVGKGEMFARQQQSLGLSSLAHIRNTKALRLVESL